MNFFRKTVLFFSRPLHICRLRLLYFPIHFGHEPVRIMYPATLVRIGCRAVGHCYGIQFAIFQFARSLSALFIAAPAVYGTGVAAYQIWLQSLPPGTAPSCGAPWTFRLAADLVLCFDWFATHRRGFWATAPSRTIYSASPCRFGVFLYFSFVVLLLLWAG